MNCIACGKPISGSAAFCNFCGTAQGAGARQAAAPPPNPVPPASPRPGSAGRVALIVVLAIAGVLIILAVVVAVGAYAWFRFNSGPTVTNDKAMEQVLVAPPPPPPPPPPPQSAAKGSPDSRSMPAWEQGDPRPTAHTRLPQRIDPPQRRRC